MTDEGSHSGVSSMTRVYQTTAGLDSLVFKKRLHFEGSVPTWHFPKLDSETETKTIPRTYELYATPDIELTVPVVDARQGLCGGCWFFAMATCCAGEDG